MSGEEGKTDPLPIHVSSCSLAIQGGKGDGEGSNREEEKARKSE